MATKASPLHSTTPRPSRRCGRALILALLLGGYMAAHANRLRLKSQPVGSNPL